MPVPGQSSLTNIDASKELAIGYQPLLVAEITLWDGITKLFLATENFDSEAGGVQYSGNDYEPRIMTESLGAIQSVTDNGIVQSPQVTLTLADADGELWNQYEIPDGLGFKGAKLVLKFIFFDPVNLSFSSDSLIKFVGICNAPQSDDRTLTLLATNILNLANFNLPPSQICRECINIFPADDAGRARANTVGAPEYRCGYSPDKGGAGNHGTPDLVVGGITMTDGNGIYINCDYSWQGCIDRLGNSALPASSTDPSVFVQIEQDQQGNRTGRFAGIHYDPPLSWRGRAYVSGTLNEGINQTNEAKFNDYYPLIYGTSFVEPPVMQVIGDPNTTRFEVVLCSGLVWTEFGSPGPIQYVIVNDFVVPFRLASPDKTVLGWSWINGGDRNGTCNRDAIYNGMGDPYGSLVCIEIVVPVAVQDSGSIPQVRVLTNGPMLRVWNSPDPSDFTMAFTTDPAAIMADLLSWCNLQVNSTRNDLDLQSFLYVNAIDNVLVNYIDLTGTQQQHPRYQLGFALRQRRSAAEIINNLLNGFKGYLAPSDLVPGTLGLYIKQTLGDDQNFPVAGSNYNTAISSATGADTSPSLMDSIVSASGFVAYSFDESNIARKGPDRDSASTLKIEQRAFSDTPNIIQVNFQDEDYFYSADSLTTTDTGDISRIGQQINGNVSAEGMVNFDQCRRVNQTQLAAQFRGNPRTGSTPTTNDSGGTWIADFETSYKAIRLRVGQIIAISSKRYQLVQQLFRILAISPVINCERIAIRAEWHEDDWYLDSYGANPDPILQAQRKQRLLRPPFGWDPNFEAPWAHDVMFDPTELTFGLAQQYQAAADGTSIVNLQVTGHLPVNSFTSLTSAPWAPIAETDKGAGTLLDATYWMSVAATDIHGALSAPSSPLAQIATTGGASSITLSNIYWQPGSHGYKVYAGTNPNKLSLQASGSGTPASVAVTAYNAANEQIPDVMFNNLAFFVKKVWNSGIWGAQVTAIAGANVTLNGPTGSYAGRTVSFIGKQNFTSDLPIIDATVSSSAAGVFTFLNMPDAALAGISIGDVAICRTSPDTVTPNTIGDSLFVNEVDYYDPPIQVTDATDGGREYPGQTIITLATGGDYVTGDEVLIKGVNGNTAANGTWIVTVPASRNPVFNATHLLLPVISNGDWLNSNATAQHLTHGFEVNGEVGRIIRIVAGTGRFQTRKIISNTATVLTIDGTWDTLPDATSRFIIEDAAWLLQSSTSAQHNSDPTAIIQAAFGVSNFLNTVLWVQAFTQSATGALSIDLDSPGREIFVFGAPGGATTTGYQATFVFGRSAAGGADLVLNSTTNRLPIKVPGSFTFWDANIDIPSMGADIHVDILKYVDGINDVSLLSSPIVIPAGSNVLIKGNDFSGDNSGTATVLGSAITATTGSFSASMVGGLIYFNEETTGYTITGFTDSSDITIAGSPGNGINIDWVVPAPAVEDGLIYAKLLQIGTTTPGQSLTLNLYWTGQG